MRIIVIGVGQTLRGDDAAGVEAVRRWRQTYPATAQRIDIAVEFTELPGLGLLDLLEGFNAALLVDAVQSGRAAGYVHRLGVEDLEAFATASKSAHGWGIAESLKLGSQVNLLPPEIRIRLIGIEVQQVEVGQSLSAVVEEAMPEAAHLIEEEVQALLAGN